MTRHFRSARLKKTHLGKRSTIGLALMLAMSGAALFGANEAQAARDVRGCFKTPQDAANPALAKGCNLQTEVFVPTNERGCPKGQTKYICKLKREVAPAAQAQAQQGQVQAPQATQANQAQATQPQTGANTQAAANGEAEAPEYQLIKNGTVPPEHRDPKLMSPVPQNELNSQNGERFFYVNTGDPNTSYYASGHGCTTPMGACSKIYAHTKNGMAPATEHQIRGTLGNVLTRPESGSGYSGDGSGSGAQYPGSDRYSLSGEPLPPYMQPHSDNKGGDKGGYRDLVDTRTGAITREYYDPAKMGKRSDTFASSDTNQPASSTTYADGSKTELGPDGKLTTTYADGSKISVKEERDAKGNLVKRTVDKAENLKPATDGTEERFDESEYADGPCGVSSRLSTSAHKQANCAATQKWVQWSKTTNQVTQIAGSGVTQVMGQAAQNKAMQEGTMSANMEASADMARATGYTQMIAGTINMGLGTVQISRGGKHSKSADVIEAGLKKNQFQITQTNETQTDGKSEGQHGYIKGEDNTVAQAAVEAFDLNQKSGRSLQVVTGQEANASQLRDLRNAQAEEKLKHIQGEAKRISRSGTREQRSVASEAKAGGFMSMMTGVQQAVGGAINVFVVAKSLDKSAEALKNVENGNGVSAPPLPGLGDNMDGGGVAPAPVPPLGSGENPNTGATEEESSDFAGGPDLGDEPMIGDQGGLKDKIAAGEFKTKAGAGPAGGGGSPAGVGGTSPATSQGEAEAGARYAAMDKNGSRYDGGGGGGYSGGGGGGGGGGNGPDLSGLLAQFLPKKDEDRLQNGIMSFGERGPAGQEGFSVLDKNTNIFERIHETYQEKNKRGHVGI